MKGILENNDQFMNGSWTFGKTVDVTGRLSASGGISGSINATRGGDVYVHSGVGNDGGGPGVSTIDKPFASIDYAIGTCTASRGDIIHAMPGHTESVIAAAGLANDVAGVTVIFYGNGSNRATIEFGTDVAADMDVDAENVTYINPLFTSAIDALTGPIDVNAANFTLLNSEYQEGAAMQSTDVLVATAAATGLTINGFRYISDALAANTQSVIQLNGVDDAVLMNIYGIGDFGTGFIENVTDELLNVHMENIYIKNLNAGPIPGIVLDANCTGFAKNLNIRIASGSTYLSSLGLLNYSMCLGFNADAESGDPIGTADAASTEAKVDAILVDTATTIPATITTAQNDLDIITGATGVNLLTASQASLDAVEGYTVAQARCVEKTDGAVLTGNDDIFVVSGGPVDAIIVGFVDVIVGGASNGDLQIVTTIPAATFTLNAAPVAIDNDAAGTFYNNVGATSVFTPSAGLGAALVDPVTVEDTVLRLSPGTVHFRSSAAQTGNIRWCCIYKPLTPSSLVTAAV